MVPSWSRRRVGTQLLSVKVKTHMNTLIQFVSVKRFIGKMSKVVLISGEQIAHNRFVKKKTMTCMKKYLRVNWNWPRDDYVRCGRVDSELMSSWPKVDVELTYIYWVDLCRVNRLMPKWLDARALNIIKSHALDLLCICTVPFWRPSVSTEIDEKQIGSFDFN